MQAAAINAPALIKRANGVLRLPVEVLVALEVHKLAIAAPSTIYLTIALNLLEPALLVLSIVVVVAIFFINVILNLITVII